MSAESKFYHLGFDRNQQPTKRRRLDENPKVPKWLNGSFVRNGPGRYHVGEMSFNHWFDGLGMLHKFDFNQGVVHYQSDFLDCHATNSAVRRNFFDYQEFATDPCWGLFGRLRSIFKYGPSDSAKVNLAKVGERYFALGETTMQIEFDIQSLETKGYYNFKQPKFGTSSTAHPHFSNNEVYNLITKYGPVNSYKIKKMNKAATEVGSSITFTPSYMHSFGMTKNYFIVAESPFVVQSIKLILCNRPFIENYYWNKNRGTKLYFIDRKSGRLIHKKEIEPFFYFHFVNAFENESEVIFDIVTYPDAEIIESYYLDRLQNPDEKIPPGRLKRFTIDLNKKNYEVKTLSKEGIELPVMDYDRYYGDYEYRFVYAMGLKNDRSRFYDQITKIDIQNNTALFWNSEGCYPGEPVFIPSPDSTGEDDGVLLSLVLDTGANQSYLLILEANTLKEITRINAPEPILVGFHGQYFNKEIA